jgi:cell division protein FtsN
MEVNARLEMKTFWRVQVGAFRKKENADRFCAQLAADGYDAFVVEVDSRYDPAPELELEGYLDYVPEGKK